MTDGGEKTAAGGRLSIRVGVAGLGRAAILEHIPELLSLPERFTVAAVCDLLKPRRDHVESICPDARPYRRIDDMLDDPDLDLIDICTRSPDHAAHAAAALKRGKWTVLESPMAMDHAGAVALRAQAIHADNRLIVRHPCIFDPDFLLARKMMRDRRLGEIHEVKIRHEDYIRRGDWQSVRKCGGGVLNHAMPGAMLQALALLQTPPVKMWAEQKHIVSLGDADDYARAILRTRDGMTAVIEVSDAHLPPPEPSFTICGSLGRFTVMPGMSEGVLHAIDPDRPPPRRRCSVRTPPLEAPREDLRIVDIPVSLDEAEKARSGRVAFWNAVWRAVRLGEYFPATLEDSIEVLRFTGLMVQNASK